MAGLILTLLVIVVLVNVGPAWAITVTPSSPIPNTTFTISGNVGGDISSLQIGSTCIFDTVIFSKSVGPGAYSVDVVGGLPAGQYCARTYVEGWYIFTVGAAPTFITVVVEVPFSICVIQLGVREPSGTVAWLPGYAYPSTPISQCQNKTDVLGEDVLGETVMFHQFIQNRTSYMIVTIPAPG